MTKDSHNNNNNSRSGKKNRQRKKQQQRGADVLTRYCWKSLKSVATVCGRSKLLSSIYLFFSFFFFFCGLRISPYISHSILLAGAILFLLCFETALWLQLIESYGVFLYFLIPPPLRFFYVYACVSMSLLFFTFLQSREIGNRSSSTSLMTDNGHIQQYSLCHPTHHPVSPLECAACLSTLLSSATWSNWLGNEKPKHTTLEFDEPRRAHSFSL